MFRVLVPAFLVALGASSSGAQSSNAADIPPGHRPPPGMCRVWIDGVPPGQQAAPTDCATAVRNRPANGRVIFGDEKRRDEDKDVRARDKQSGKVERERGKSVEQARDDDKDVKKSADAQVKSFKPKKATKPKPVDTPKKQPPIGT